MSGGDDEKNGGDKEPSKALDLWVIKVDEIQRASHN